MRRQTPLPSALEQTPRRPTPNKKLVEPSGLFCLLPPDFWLGPLCRLQLGDERVDRGTHLLGGLHKLDSGLVDDLLLFYLGDPGVGDTPLDDDRGGAQRQP